MIFPPPLPGLVIRFSFLWSHEAKMGLSEARKDRPCAIVIAVGPAQAGDTRVAVVPVTHGAPHDPATSIELSAQVKAALGLDPERSWVRLDELNVFAWPGYDLRFVPGTDRIDYGPLPQPIFERIRQGVATLNRARRVRQVSRD